MSLAAPEPQVADCLRMNRNGSPAYRPPRARHAALAATLIYLAFAVAACSGRGDSNIAAQPGADDAYPSADGEPSEISAHEVPVTRCREATNSYFAISWEASEAEGAAPEVDVKSASCPTCDAITNMQSDFDELSDDELVKRKQELERLIARLEAYQATHKLLCIEELVMSESRVLAVCTTGLDEDEALRRVVDCVRAATDPEEYEICTELEGAERVVPGGLDGPRDGVCTNLDEEFLAFVHGPLDDPSARPPIKMCSELLRHVVNVGVRMDEAPDAVVSDVGAEMISRLEATIYDDFIDGCLRNYSLERVKCALRASTAEQLILCDGS